MRQQEVVDREQPFARLGSGDDRFPMLLRNLATVAPPLNGGDGFANGLSSPGEAAELADYIIGRANGFGVGCICCHTPFYVLCVRMSNVECV